MQFVIAYYHDAQDGRPANEFPLRHGPVVPHPELTIDAVDRRTSPALIIGRLPEEAELAAGMTQIDESAHQQMLADVATWRENLAAKELAAARQKMVISRFQARAVLRQMDLREQVETLMSHPDADPFMVDAWTDAQEFRRTSPTLAAVAALLGLAEEQLDEMFEVAARIEA